MSNAVRIGPRGAPFPGELWRCVFEQAPTLRDAQCWAEAFDRPITPGDYRALLHVAAPALLTILPKPLPCALFAPRPDVADVTGCLFDYSPLLGSLYDDSTAAIASPKDFTCLFDVTRAMTAFAPQSAITDDLLHLSHEAWSACFANEAHDESAYRSRCSSTALLDALRHHSASATLWLGHKAKLPPFYAGLPALRTLQLLDLDAPLDLRPLQTLQALTDITLGADILPATSAWFRKAMGRLAPHVRITQHAQTGRTPPMPPRLGSEAWFDLRQTSWWAPPSDATTASRSAAGERRQTPEPSEKRTEALASLQQLLADIDRMHATSRF